MAMALHWGMALLILALLLLGVLAANWPLSPLKLKLFFWHKSLGLLVLALTAPRLLWRALDTRPAWPPDMPLGERRLARLAHAALYGLMLALPLSGWLINSAADLPFRVFGLWPLPALVPPDEALKVLAQGAHLALVLALLALLAAHVAAALRHHRRGDGVLAAMLPPRLLRPRP
jgi:cytochrome b561